MPLPTCPQQYCDPALLVLFFRAFFQLLFSFLRNQRNLVVHKSTCSFNDKRITWRNVVSLLIAFGLENHDIISHSQNHVIFSRLLFLDGSFRQAETYSLYRACKNLTIYSFIFTSLLLQWNSVIPHLWMILCCKCMVINTYMVPVMTKIFSSKSVASKS